MPIENDFNNQTSSTSPLVSETNITPVKTHTHPAIVCADTDPPPHNQHIEQYAPDDIRRIRRHTSCATNTLIGHIPHKIQKTCYNASPT